MWSVISSSMTRCTAAHAVFTVRAPPEAERLTYKGSMQTTLRTASEPLHTALYEKLCQKYFACFAYKYFFTAVLFVTWKLQ